MLVSDLSWIGTDAPPRFVNGGAYRLRSPVFSCAPDASPLFSPRTVSGPFSPPRSIPSRASRTATDTRRPFVGATCQQSRAGCPLRCSCTRYVSASINRPSLPIDRRCAERCALAWTIRKKQREPRGYFQKTCDYFCAGILRAIGLRSGPPFGSRVADFWIERFRIRAHTNRISADSQGFIPSEFHTFLVHRKTQPSQSIESNGIAEKRGVNFEHSETATTTGHSLRHPADTADCCETVRPSVQSHTNNGPTQSWHLCANRPVTRGCCATGDRTTAAR